MLNVLAALVLAGSAGGAVAPSVAANRARATQDAHELLARVALPAGSARSVRPPPGAAPTIWQCEARRAGTTIS